MRSKTIKANFDERRIDALLAGLDGCHLPGAAAGIAIDGITVYRKAFGLASLQLPAILTPTTRVAIFSITKQFACLAYLLLCEGGRAGIDDPISRYLPELHPVTHRVTVRQLMGNTSGLRDALMIHWQSDGIGLRLEFQEVLRLYRHIDEVSFAPDSSWCYNNGGFLLLSAIIERIAGQPLHEVLRERIFNPIGMYDTVLRRFDTDYLPNVASNHALGAAGSHEKVYLGTEAAGAGGMVSTIDDLLRWMVHMDAPSVGTPAAWTAMRTPRTVASGASSGYGFGILDVEYRGLGTVSHAGGGPGGNAQILKVPAAGLDVVVLTNRHDVFTPQLAYQILDACLPHLQEREAALEPMTCFAEGTYYSSATGRVVQLFERDGEQILSVDLWDRPVRLAADGALWPAPLYAYLKQPVKLLGAPRQPSSVILDDFGNRDELFAVSAEGERELPSARYRCEAIGIDAQIFVSDDGPRLLTTGHHGRVNYRLEPLAGNFWRASSPRTLPASAIVRFEDGHGVFHFRANRNSLRFRRIP